MLRVMYVTAIQDADGTRAGRKDYRLRYDEVPEAYAREIRKLIDSAKREARIEEMQMLQQKAEFMERAGMNFKPAAHAHNRLIRLEQSEESI